MPEVNLLSAAAVLFKGGTFTELSDWCTTMGVQMIGQTTFYAIQITYLHPAIEHLYQDRRREILARVYLEQEDGKRPHLAGNGRCDSPGFKAKYCHYTFMLEDTKEILHQELVQSTEATSSGAMEPLGFRRGMTELLDLGLDVEDQRMRMWIDKESSAFQALSSLVLNQRLLEDLDHMALFKHTGQLETFHSAMLKYLPKRQAFSYHGMRERAYLAILDHNENIIKRKQGTTVKGEVRFNQVYCKKSKQWMLKKIFTAHTTNFVGELIERVLEYRRNVNIKYKTPTSSIAVPQPDLPPNIAPLPKPAKALFKSRF
ncbi:hypothetical protein F2P79_020905 [Pimephales promelas]|nr:hypothetical protein F2P79_020905 [Pimephales promelas]